MNRIILLVFIAYLPCICFAQNSKGVIFEHRLNWEAVLQEAQRTNKFIFVDVAATWCKPCKMMDDHVFSNEEVGNFYNQNFLSVKIQVDTSVDDNDLTIAWYKDAFIVKERYDVRSFPTYLFFSPDGKITHKEIGFKPVINFLKTGHNALDSSTQYYRLLEKYREGHESGTWLRKLALFANSINEKDVAKSIANAYIEYVKTLSEDSIYTKENIEFLWNFVTSSTQDGFNIIYRNADRINSVLGSRDIAQGIVSFVIGKEDLDPYLFKMGRAERDVDWKKLETVIRLKYNKAIAKKVILDGKIRYFTVLEKWKEAIKYNVQKIDKYGTDTSFMGRVALNNLVWDIILPKTDERKVLKKALNWMEQVVKLDPNDAAYIDTYAHVLFKLGNKAEAIKWEEKAVSLAPNDEELEKALKKMKLDETIR